MKGWYEGAEKQVRLTDVNAIFLHGIAGLLGLRTRIVSDTVDLEGAARLLDGTPHRESGKTLVIP